MNSKLEALGINHSYGDTPVITDLKMTIPTGQVYGFLGRNGAGKSTVMKILLGLLKPASGHVIFDGRQVETKDPAYLARIGSLIEEPSYYPNLTGVENIRYVSKVRNTDSREDELLDLVGLSPKARNRKAGQYSLGMKQRLGIALSLVGDPDLLLLDEPTNGLDPEGIREIRDLILYFARELGKTVVVSSHILSEIEQMADTVGIIHEGRMRYQGALSELSGNPTIVLDVLDGKPASEILNREKMSFEALGEHEFSLPFESRGDTAELVSWLVHNDIDVAQVSVHQRTLEDAFLELTSEKGGRHALD